MRHYRLKIKRRDRRTLEALLRCGQGMARVLRRCRILLLSGQGRSKQEISGLLQVAPDTVQRIRDRYRREGLDWLIRDKPRSGRPREITNRQAQGIVALACSEPPRGRLRWTERLLVREACRRKIVPRIGKTSVGEILRGHRIKPWREKNVVRAGVEPGISPLHGRRVGCLP